ncbi:MAG TPA: 50S ribosomal protein L24 [Chloroflexota bacterium]|nr:50S ribosomal protein L24 [Chloroflexota bacterium]
MAAKVRKNDTVQVLTGRDKGKTGKVTRVLTKEDRVVVDGINIRKRHTKAKRPGEQAGIVEFPAPLQVSNVGVVCPKCGKATRVGFRTLEDGTKVRVCRRDGEVIDNG